MGKTVTEHDTWRCDIHEIDGELRVDFGDRAPVPKSELIKLADALVKYAEKYAKERHS